MRPYDLITFDCYGTLIDWERGIKSTISRVAREAGVRVRPSELVGRYVQIEFAIEQAAYRTYREVLGLALRALFQEQGVSLSARRSGALAASLPEWRPFRETSSVLRRLKRAGYRLAVLSNVDDSLLRRSLRRVGVEFDHLVTAQQVRSYKPCHRHWERVLALSRTPKRRVLHVAASQLHDVIPAKTLGLSCAWINRGGERGLPGSRPDRVFPDLRPLARWLAA